MAITVSPKPNVQLTTGDNGQATVPYLVKGTDDELAAAQALGSAVPATYCDLVLKNCHVEEFDGIDSWVGIATYCQPQEKAKPIGESTFSFDTTGGTQHVTQGRSNVSRNAPAGKTAPDYHGAIGVTPDSVEGVDITVPVYAFSETHILPDSAVTVGYRGTLFALTGKVNDGSFKGCAAGECLFLGASGSKRGNGDWEISFKFAASPNRTGIAIGDIAPFDKEGWDYLWVRYEDKEDAAAKALVKRPVAAYVEKVYEDGDFSGLGIGT